MNISDLINHFHYKIMVEENLLVRPPWKLVSRGIRFHQKIYIFHLVTINAFGRRLLFFKNEGTTQLEEEELFWASFSRSLSS